MTSTAGVRKILRGSAWFLGARVVTDGARFARVVVIATLASPESFGTVAAALVIVSLLDTFTEPGLGTSIVQAGERRREALGSVLAVQVIRSVALAAGLWIAAPGLEHWFGLSRLGWACKGVGLTLVAKGALNPAAALLGREYRYRPLALLNCVEPVVSVVVFAVCVRGYSGLESIVFGLIAGQTAKTVTSYLISPLRPAFALSLGFIKPHFAYGRWVLASQIVVFLSLQGDNAFVAKAFGAAALGVYQVAFRLSELPALLTTAVVGQAAFPAFSAVNVDRQRLSSEFFSLQRMLLTVNCGLGAAIWVAGRPLIRLAFGPEWQPAADLLGILVIAGVIRSMLSMGGWLFLAAGAPRFNFYMNAVRFAAFALAVVPLSGGFGVWGVGAAVAIGSCCAVPVYVFGIHSTIRGDWRRHFLPAREPHSVSVAQ